MKTLAKLLILLTLGSCSVYNESLTPGQIQREMLMYPDPDTRRIVGYKNGFIFKNRVYYKVVDGHGHKAPDIKEHPDSLLRPVNSYLSLADEYAKQN